MSVDLPVTLVATGRHEYWLCCFAGVGGLRVNLVLGTPACHLVGFLGRMILGVGRMILGVARKAQKTESVNCQRYPQVGGYGMLEVADLKWLPQHNHKKKKQYGRGQLLACLSCSLKILRKR
jgi:hypothetical protein